MSKLIKIISLLFVLINFLFVLPKLQNTYGQICTGCTSYVTLTVECPPGSYNSTPNDRCTVYYCDSGEICGGACGPGDYQCNGGCCDIGIDPNNPEPDPEGTPSPGCSVTAPSSLTRSEPYLPTSANFTWTLGTGGTNQILIGGANKAEVEAGCPGLSSPACTIYEILPSNVATYDTGDVMSVGTVYYFKVFNYNTSETSCIAGSPTLTTLSSCEISPSIVPPIIQFESTTLTTNVNSSAEISDVSYSALNPAIVGLNPAQDFIPNPYSTLATGLTAGSTQVTSTVNLLSGLACTDTVDVSVIPPRSWWQVWNSDIQANGTLSSDVPLGQYFGLAGSGGFPGVPAYSTSTNLTNTNVSDTPSANWLANSPWSSPRIFDYAYFSNQIPDDIEPTDLGPNPQASDLTSGGEYKYGYYWYEYDGLQNPGQALTLPEINISDSVLDRKVILLVSNANLNLTGNITLFDGSGFFMAIVNGDIIVDPLVGGVPGPNLEGLYVADGEFQTGETNTQLWVRGSVVGYGGTRGVNMQRDLGGALNTDAPSEVFEYAPDQILLFPSKLGVRKINWKEVAP